MKLLAFDIDGTLAVNGQIPTPIVEAIHRLHTLGHLVTVLTGRTEPATQAVVSMLDIRLPYATWNGACIRSTDGTFFREWLLDETVIRGVVEMATGFIKEFHLETKTGFYVRQPDPSYWNWAYTAGHHILPYANYQGQPAYKLALHFKEEPTPALIKAFRNRFPKALFLVVNNLFADVTLPFAQKGSALALIARHCAIPRDNIIAFGDDWNDVTMFEQAGKGIAVAPVDSRLAHMAHEIIDSPEKLGVARWLAKAFFTFN